MNFPQKPIADTLHKIMVSAKPPTSTDNLPSNHIRLFFKSMQDYTGVDANTSYTIIITILIFGAGILTNWTINRINAWRVRKTYRQSVNLLLYNFAQECRKNYEVVKESIEAPSIVEIHSAGFQLKIIAHLYFLEKIDYSVFLNHYVRCGKKRLKTKAVTKVFEIIGSIKDMEEGAIKNMELFTNLLNDRQEVFRNSQFEIERFLERSLMTLQVVDYSVKHECINVYKKWKPHSNVTFFSNVYSNLIVPLKETLDKYPGERSLDSLYVDVDNCYRAYPDLQHIDKLVKDNFKPLSRLNHNAYRKMMVILKIFSYEKQKPRGK
ncbi:hypothetical protein [Chitinophaga rhizosphaerae]|uniref:hypothetical protein n=1 Tax=Chitinophaga rhizosphaerae TaxID=1864947 RepID=UPI000F80A5D0|nr:hypothetical protein [Chitinophaga rhizosphaerae]